MPTTFIPLSLSQIVVVVSELPESAHNLHTTKPQGQWSGNLNIDADTAKAVPTTPLSIHSQGVSTPVLPSKIVALEGTLTPHRFAPEIGKRSDTISKRIYNYVCESLILTPVFLLLWFILYFWFFLNISWAIGTENGPFLCSHPQFFQRQLRQQLSRLLNEKTG